MSGERTGGRGSFGQWLRGQREARGVGLPEIAEASKISLRYLEALESDRFDVLPAPVFVRGFLREYARVVGLDADEVVNLFLVSAPRIQTERRPEPSGGGARDGGRASLTRGLLVALGILLLLGAAAGAAFWWARRSAGPKPVIETAVPSAATAQPEPNATVSTGETGAVAAPSAPEASAPLAVAPTVPTAPPAPAQPAPAPAARTTTPEPADKPRALVVVLAFQQDCWVETRVDGGRRSSELKAGGETLTVEADESIVLTLGNAPAVRAELNGRPRTLPTDSSRLLREFHIDRSLVGEPNLPEGPGPSAP